MRKKKKSFSQNNKKESESNDNDSKIDIFLQEVFEDVENYTNTLSSRQVDNIFIEARKKSDAVKRFFYQNDERMLSWVSPELKNVLVLSKSGLDKLMKTDPKNYRKVIEKILSGLFK